MLKKILSLVLVIAITASIAVTGTMAYLTSEADDVNVMTLGNVKIDQIEQEWNEEKTELVDFTQAKPLFPYVGELGWENKDSDGGAYRRFAMNNVVDKYVSVKNTGKSDAYVRTFIALEMGSFAYEDFKMIGASVNSATGQEFPDMHWKWTDDFEAEIDGNNYNVMVAVYDEALKPGETTIPSLLQVYLDKTATNETVEKLDGNGNGTYDILVFSQAVQTAGFEPPVAATLAAEENYGPAYALNTAFGDTAEKYHPWEENAPKFYAEYATANDPQSLKDTMLLRDSYIALTDDIIVDSTTPLQWGAYMFVANGREVTIDLNGHNIIVKEDALLKTNAVFTTANGGTLNIIGDGTVEVTNGKSGIFHAMNKNDQINVYGGTYISNSDNGSSALAIIYTNSGNVDVYGGSFFTSEGIECANAEDIQGNRLSIVFHEGALLNQEKYYAGSDATRIQLEEGCSLQEVTVDGKTMYKVAK